jgi:hypothetical protein
MIGVGITVGKFIDRKNAAIDYRNWAGWVAGIWTVVGFGLWGAYFPMVNCLQNHSSSPLISQLFETLQTGAYVFPFLCWSIALAAGLAALS